MNTETGTVGLDPHGLLRHCLKVGVVILVGWRRCGIRWKGPMAIPSSYWLLQTFSSCAIILKQKNSSNRNILDF
ncbi:hypothetical protein TNIN_180661 [Trichonephila inaurata madagascariensis]|uniref:Uncharacterized protein n=1 Tax=Trichonephila inaurata madagascariensis TaxID=2747483 RepID=A0A8X6WQC3_9ARAC|nr:hypothetical protein TNIN_180661 [Trichonephila inaurata madagascariensis]